MKRLGAASRAISRSRGGINLVATLGPGPRDNVSLEASKRAASIGGITGEMP